MTMGVFFYNSITQLQYRTCMDYFPCFFASNV